jgi:hypothetical protein
MAKYLCVFRTRASINGPRRADADSNIKQLGIHLRKFGRFQHNATVVRQGSAYGGITLGHVGFRSDGAPLGIQFGKTNAG